MLKILSGVVLISMLSYWWGEALMILSCLMCVILLSAPLNSAPPMGMFFFEVSDWRGVLFFMSVLVYVFSFLVMLNSSSVRKLAVLMSILLSLSSMFFMTTDFFYLYIFFETSIIPIFIIITGWGYQVERIEASLSLFFYTLAGSLPLLLVIISMISSYLVFNINSCYLIKHPLGCSGLALGAMTAFLVKLPLYGSHMWLPKAHVEAPVGGSMILAAILLKLGGVGLYVFIPMIGVSLLNFVLLSVSLWGVLFASVICLRLNDVKMMIAYSSVGHMGFVVFGSLFGFFQSGVGVLLMMLSHGFSSSGLFMMSYLYYKLSLSRSLLLNKGLLGLSGAMAGGWFFLTMSNMGAPPSLNCLSEILILISAFKYSCSVAVILISSILFSSGYCLLMYSSVIQGECYILSGTFSVFCYILVGGHIYWSVLGAGLILLLKPSANIF